MPAGGHVPTRILDAGKNTRDGSTPKRSSKGAVTSAYADEHEDIPGSRGLWLAAITLETKRAELREGNPARLYRA